MAAFAWPAPTRPVSRQFIDVLALPSYTKKFRKNPLSCRYLAVKPPRVPYWQESVVGLMQVIVVLPLPVDVLMLPADDCVS